MVARGILQPPLDQIDVTLWRLDAALRLFLKRMQDVDGLAEAYRVNGPVSVPVEVFNQLHCAATKPLQRLCRWRVLAGLRQKQLETESVLYPRRESSVIALA